MKQLLKKRLHIAWLRSSVHYRLKRLRSSAGVVVEVKVGQVLR